MKLSTPVEPENIRARARATRTRRAPLLAAALAICGGVSCGGDEDTTPPTVVSRSPEDGATNVSVRTPIEVEFSEPLDPNSIDDATVLLAGDGSVSLAKTATLSDDGRVLTIEPLSALALTETVTVNLTSGIRDEAGNALAPDSWSWTMPDWLSYGDGPVNGYAATAAIYSSYLALDPGGDPVVASNVESAPYGDVRSWNGATWDVLTPIVAGDALVEGLAVAPGGQVYVVFEDSSDFYVSVWDGAAWSLVGDGLLLNDLNYPDAATIAVNADGDPIVAWSEKVTAGNSEGDLHVSRWNGTTWETLGGKLDINDTAALQEIRITLDLEGDPIVSWGERFFASSFVKQWNPGGAVWDALGSSLSAGERAWPVVVLPNGEIVAATVSNTGAIQLLRYTGLAWETTVNYLLTNFGFSAGLPDLAVDSGGALVVAWTEIWAGGSALYVARRTDEGFEYLGEEISVGAPAMLSNPRLVLDAEDIPSITYTSSESTNGGFAPFQVGFHYRRLNR